MDPEFGYCGYSCHLCAARSDDPIVRQKLIDGWRKFFGHESYTVENVRCDGCRNDGRLADKQCAARPCARERGVTSCARCPEFACEKVRPLLASREGMLTYCAVDKGMTVEEYNLCMRQFDSLGNIIEMLAAQGRLPGWTLTAEQPKPPDDPEAPDISPSV